MNHRLSCLSDHACKAAVVDIFGQKASLACSRRASSETPLPIKVLFKYLIGFSQHLVIGSKHREEKKDKNGCDKVENSTLFWHLMENLHDLVRQMLQIFSLIPSICLIRISCILFLF